MSLSDIGFSTAPDVPTVRDLGYDFDVTSWFGFGGPKGLPDDVVKKWEEVIQKTLEDPEFQEAAEKLQTPLEWMPGDEYNELINNNYEVYGDIINNSN